MYRLLSEICILTCLGQEKRLGVLMHKIPIRTPNINLFRSIGALCNLTNIHPRPNFAMGNIGGSRGPREGAAGRRRIEHMVPIPRFCSLTVQQLHEQDNSRTRRWTLNEQGKVIYRDDAKTQRSHQQVCITASTLQDLTIEWISLLCVLTSPQVFFCCTVTATCWGVVAHARMSVKYMPGNCHFHFTVVS